MKTNKKIPVIIIVVVLVLAVIGASVLIIPKVISRKKDKESKAAIGISSIMDSISKMMNPKNNSNNNDDDSDNKNNNSKDDKEKGQSAKSDEKAISFEDIIKREKDPAVREVLERVKKLTEGKYKKFTIQYNVNGGTSEEGNLESVVVNIFENAEAPKIPTYDNYLATFKGSKLNDFQHWGYKREDYQIFNDQLFALINAVEGNSMDSGLTYAEDTPKDVNFPAQVVKYFDNDSVYYIYDESNGKLYKKETKAAPMKEIYQYDPTKESPATIKQSVDFDGDGKEEAVRIDTVRRVLAIDNVSILLPEHDYYVPQNKVVDIDKTDGKRELVIMSSLPSDHYYNTIVYYKNHMINVMDILPGDIDVKGDGTITCSNILAQFFETHSYSAGYKLNKDYILEEIPQEIYTYTHVHYNNDTNAEVRELTVKEPVHLLKDKNSTEVAVALKTGDKVKVIGTDNKRWVLLENSQGVKGWLEIINDFTVKELGKETYDVFDGIVLAG